MSNRSLLVIVLLSLLSAEALSANPLQAYPPPAAGMTRYVAELPPQADESAYKVQLLVGKAIELDAGNRYFFGGQIEQEIVSGWGYPRYVVKTLGAMAGTRMAVDPNAPRVMRFVALGGDPFLIRYNSRLPVVVYVPDGTEVRYRVWSAADETVKLDRR